MNKVRIWVVIETPQDVRGIDPAYRFSLQADETIVEHGASLVEPPPPPLPPLVLPKATKMGKRR